jgi:TraY domain
LRTKKSKDAGGRRRGRPALPFGEAKRASFNTRLRNDTKERLEKEARTAGRSLSEEIEYRLEQSIQVQDAQCEAFGGELPLKLMLALAALAAATSAVRGKDWLREKSVFDEVIGQWLVALRTLRPGVIFESVENPGIQWNLPDAVKDMPSNGAAEILSQMARELTDKSLSAAIKDTMEQSLHRAK